MPAPLDLTGQRYGRLTVVRADGRVFWGHEQNAWLCRCDCGAELRLPTVRLRTKRAAHRIDACDACRARPCEICGAPVSASSSALTCSDDCRRERERRYQLAWYHEKRREDPAERAAHSERGRRAWAEASPEKRREMREMRVRCEGRERINERARLRHAERMATDPAYREAKRASGAKFARAHPDEVKKAGREYRRRTRAAIAARELGDFMGKHDGGE